MNGIWQISWRYFRSPVDRFNSVIQLFAIGGIAIGSMSLLLTLMITDGLEKAIYHKLLNIDAHITIQNLEFSENLNPKTIKQISQISYISQLFKIGLYQGITLSASNKAYPILLFTVNDLSLYGSYNILAQTEPNSKPIGDSEIIIDQKTAQIHNLNVGDSLLFMGIDITQNPPARYIHSFHIRDIKTTSIASFEQSIALSTSKHLLKQAEPNRTIWQMWLSDTSYIENTYQQIKKQLDFPWYAQTIDQKYENVMAWVELQQSLGPIMISVLLLISILNLIGTLLLTVVYNMRDLAILQSLGMTSINTRSIIFIQGFLKTAIGLSIGLITASILAYSQEKIHWMPLPEKNFFVDFVPIAFNLEHYIWIILIALGLCLLASWLPAYFVTKINILSIIRWRR